MPISPPSQGSPGWYPDPNGDPSHQRRWNGSAWTNDLRPLRKPNPTRADPRPPPPDLAAEPVRPRIFPPPDPVRPPAGADGPSADLGERAYPSDRSPRFSPAQLLWLGAGGALALAVLAFVVFATNTFTPTTTRPTSGISPPGAAQPPTAQYFPGDPVTDHHAGIAYTPPQGWPDADLKILPFTSGKELLVEDRPQGRGGVYATVRAQPLPSGVAYRGPQDLAATDARVADLLVSSYVHDRYQRSNLETRSLSTVLGHPARMLKFHIAFTDAAALGWRVKGVTSAVVVLDRGTGKRPAVLYLEIPDVLDVHIIDNVIRTIGIA